MSSKGSAIFCLMYILHACGTLSLSGDGSSGVAFGWDIELDVGQMMYRCMMTVGRWVWNLVFG